MRDEDNGSSALMRAAIAGDGGAYARVLTQLAGVVRGAVARHFRRIGYGNEEIEDVVQETLLAIHLKRSSWDPEQPLEPWVRAIARNKVIDHLRRRGYRKFVPIDDVAEVLATPPAEAALSNGDRDRMLATLNGRQREIVTVMTVDGLNARETAERFGMSEGAVRVALHRGLKALSARFGKDET